MQRSFSPSVKTEATTLGPSGSYAVRLLGVAATTWLVAFVFTPVALAASTLTCTQDATLVDCEYSVDATDQAALAGYSGAEFVYAGIGWAACTPDPDSCGGMSSGGGSWNGDAEVMTGTFQIDASAYCAAPEDVGSYIWLRDGNTGAALSQGEVFVVLDCDAPPAGGGGSPWTDADPWQRAVVLFQMPLYLVLLGVGLIAGKHL